MFVDSHCHLFYDDYKNDFDDVLQRALDTGVHAVIIPGTDLQTSMHAIQLAEKNDCVYAAVGFHPHDAKKADDASLKKIEELSYHRKVVAIGEIGIDYFYDFSPKEKQQETFLKQIKIAQRRNLPIIIHERESRNDILRIIEEEINNGNTKKPKGVFHCFNGDETMAKKVIEWGFYISVTGPVTFPEKTNKPNSMAAVVKKIPMHHILLETDSPYLTPAPNRGKRNEPANIPYIAKKIAELKNISTEDVARASTFGVHKLFGIGKYPEPVFTYQLRNSLYINHTIRCNADCIFCNRKGEAILMGQNLKIEKEPSAEEIINSIGNPGKFDEIVFCGYGEPTIRFDVLKEIARWVKQNGGKTRLNTDGHGNVINHRNIVPELQEIIDAVSVSLNSAEKKQYSTLMRVNESMFDAMVEFSKQCVAHKIPTTMTIIEMDSVDELQAKEFVEKKIGAQFRGRELF